MNESSTEPASKTTAYWSITLLVWGVVLVLVGVSIWCAAQGQIASFIGLLVIAAAMLLAIHQPKWLQRFADSIAKVRGL